MRPSTPFFRGLRVAVLVSSLCFIAGACLADRIPVEVFGHLPSIENVEVSPDGTRLALVRTKDDQRILIVLSLAEGKALSSQEVAGIKVRDVEWADNNDLLLTISRFTHTRGTVGGNLSEHYVLASINLSKNSVVNPLEKMPERDDRDHALYASNEIIGEPVTRKVDGKNVVVVPGLSAGLESTDASGQMFLMPALFKFKAGVNISSLVVRSTSDSTEWLIDDKGEEFVSYTYDEDSRKWTLNVRIDGKWRQVYSDTFSIEAPDVAGVSPDGKALWISYVDNKSEESKWMSISLADGSVTQAPPATEEYTSFLVSRYSPRIIAGYRDNGRTLQFFDPKIQETWNVILRQFDGEHVEFVSASDNFDKIVIQVDGIRDGYRYLLFDANTYKFTLVGQVYDGLSKLAEVKKISYEASDHLKLAAYVTYPTGDRKNLPVVMLPHGGPEAHDSGDFDYWAQAFAAQGYLVVQPNFRGSDTTVALRNAGFGEWGAKMQTDLTDALHELVKEGVADPKRVCIVGGSYGGYAALAGAALPVDRGIYRCAVSDAGISDLKQFRHFIVSKYERFNSSGTRYFDRYLGASGPDDAVLQQRSPIQFAADVNIPVLLIHGKDDAVVPYEQSRLMYDALKKAGKQVEFVTLKHEDHWLSNSDTRMQMLQAMVDFLLKNNPPN